MERRDQVTRARWRQNEQWLNALLAYEGHRGRLASELLEYDPKHKVSVSTLPKFVLKKAGGGRATPLVIREVAAGPYRAARDEGDISPRLAAAVDEYAGDESEPTESEEVVPVVQQVRASSAQSLQKRREITLRAAQRLQQA